MKKLTVGILAFFCLMLSVFAADYKYPCDNVTQMEKMTSTQLRLAILERYDNEAAFKSLIQLVATEGSAKLQNRFALALQQVFTSKAAVSAAARKATAEYALILMRDVNASAYTAADGSYRIVIGGSKPTYKDDDDYTRVSEPATSL